MRIEQGWRVSSTWRALPACASAAAASTLPPRHARSPACTPYQSRNAAPPKRSTCNSSGHCSTSAPMPPTPARINARAGAGQHHPAHMPLLQALAQHEGILRTDGDDEAGACEQAGSESGDPHQERARQQEDAQGAADGHLQAILFSLSCTEKLKRRRRGPGTSATVAFAAVLEEGSFEAAARRLSISPSALSQRIRALEDRLGKCCWCARPRAGLPPPVRRCCAACDRCGTGSRGPGRAAARTRQRRCAHDPSGDQR